MNSFSTTVLLDISMACGSRPLFPHRSNPQTPNYTPLLLLVSHHDQSFIDQYQEAQRLRNPDFTVERLHLSTFNDMASSNPEDMEEFQRLSDRYQPEVEVSIASGLLEYC